MECEVMVSNEEIKRMLENRRRGIKTEAKKEPSKTVPPKTGQTPMKSSVQTCESCGGENPPDAKFCIKCGGTLQVTPQAEETKPEETPDILPRSGMDGIDYKTCPNCSHQNKPQAKFCVVCGHKLDEVEVSTSTGSPLDQVPDEAEAEEPVVEQATEEENLKVAELIDEESVQEETQKRSILSRKVPEEEISAEEAVVETTAQDITPEPVEDVDRQKEVAEVEEVAPEEVSAPEAITEIDTTTTPETTSESAPPETIPETTSETLPDKVALEEESPVETPDEETELPQVKTFKFGQNSLEMDEEPVAEELTKEEVDEDTAPAAESPTDPMEKIKKAKELLDIGAITEDEFEEIKKKYLAMI
jgi:ribosomal protein L40E